jgi:predicted O-linked N-acetylglucosamine transferase (SPINDLY family)/capsular polysaccharide biosynthesis protein
MSKSHTKLQAALDALRLGDVDRATSLARKVARKTPGAWGAAYVLGLAALARADAAQARGHLEQALRLNPAAAEVRLPLGDALRQAGALAEAAVQYQAAAGLAPDNPLPHFNLGLIGEAAGDNGAALAHYARAVELAPAFPEAWNNLGNMQRASGDIAAAEASYRRAAELRPAFAEAWDNLGVLCEHDLGDDRQARAVYERALAANPDLAQAHFHLGALAFKAGLEEQAVAQFEKVLQLRPDHAEAYNNLGMIFCGNGFMPEAQSCFERALQFNPDLAEAHNNLGILFSRLERLEEAEVQYRAAIARCPDLAQAYYGLGLTLAGRGDASGAIAAFLRACELRPDYGEPALQLGKAYQAAGDLDLAKSWLRKAQEITGWDIPRLHEAMLLPPIMESVECVLTSRSAMEAAFDRLLGDDLVITEEEALQHADTNFFLAYHGMNDRRLQERLAAAYLRACPSLGFMAPHVAGPRRAGRIRIGFVSRFLHNHSVGKFFGPIVEHLAGRPEFEVLLFPIGRNEDAVLARTAAVCAEVVQIDVNSFDLARRAIAERQLDILVYPEIGMDPFTYLLAFSRLGRVQCVLQGHSVTTGIPAVDYFVSSALIEPESGQEQYSERLVLLRTLPMHIEPPVLPEQFASRDELGLPADRRLYVCPMKLQKVHPEMDWAIGEILRQDSAAEVVFVADDRNASWQALLKQRFVRAMGDLAERVRFIPWIGSRDRFIGLLHAADAVLDSFHHGGATTSHLCLASGVPMATWVSQTSRSRFILAYYSLMEIDDCIAETPRQFIDIALRLANDKNWRRGIAERIRRAAPRLYDNEGMLAEHVILFSEMAVQAEQPRAVPSPYVPVSGLKDWCSRRNAKYVMAQPPMSLDVVAPDIVGGDAVQPARATVVSPEGYLAELADVEVISGHGVILADGGRTALLDLEGRDPSRVMIPDWLIYHHLDNHLLLRPTRTDQAPVKEGIWLAGQSSGNYYHWLLEFLPRLKTVEGHPEYRGLPFIVDAGLHENLIECLRRLAPERELIPLQPRHRYRFERLVVPSNLNSLPHDFRRDAVALAQDFAFTPPAIDYLRDRLAGLDEKSVAERRRLYVVRRNPAYRRLLNADEVERFFLSRGFERVCPDDMTLAEQIEAFSQAGVIAGATGAGFANMVFAPRDATVIILYYAGVPHQYFSGLGSCIGQRVVYVFGEPLQGSHGLLYQQDYFVSPELIEKAMQSLREPIRRLGFLVHIPELVNHYRDVWAKLEPGSFEIVLTGTESDRRETEKIAKGLNIDCIYAEARLTAGERYHCLVSNHPVKPDGNPLIKRLADINVRFMYALGKAGWNMRDWNRLYDLVLCFGPDQVERLVFCKDAVKIQMGYPRFDRYFTAPADRRDLLEQHGCDPEKPVVVWLPTWRDLSSVGIYDEAIAGLMDQYNVVIKLHPLMAVDDPQRAAGLDRHGFTHVIRDSRDNLPLYQLADFLLCDYGGPAFGGIYTDKNLLLLNVPGAVDNEYTGADSPDVQIRRDVVSIDPNQADRLRPLLEDARLWEDQAAVRRRLRQRFFAPYYGFSSEIAALALRNVDRIFQSGLGQRGGESW